MRIPKDLSGYSSGFGNSYGCQSEGAFPLNQYQLFISIVGNVEWQL